MSATNGLLRPFVTVKGSAQLYNTVGYPPGGNVGSANNALFVATWATGSTTISANYIISGQILPGMSLSGIGIASGTYIVGPLSQQGTGTGGLGQYVINIATVGAFNSAVVTSGSYSAAGSVVSATSFPQNYPQGPGGIVGPIPGFNCVNIMELRDYYNLPYPPATPLVSPPVIAVVSFGGGIYGQPVTTGQYAGFWRCSDISGNTGAPIQILVVPINGAINAPNADDGGATLENTVDVATVNAFYGMIDPRTNSPIYTPPIIILYIAPSSDISEMYRTFYTVLKNPVVCNGRSYLPSIVTCSWGAPEIAWSQKMAFPPNPSIPVDNDPNPQGIAELNEINDLFAEATKNGINICCASGDIPLTTVNASINQFNYAQSLILQGVGANGNSGQIAQPQVSVFPLSDAERASLPAPQVMFPASSPYVTCVGGSAVYFPTINTGSYDNPAEFAWARANGGISTVFSIPAYQQNLPGSAATSAAQFLASSLNTANLAEAALGTPSPNGGQAFPDPISKGITAPNTAVTLATQTKEAAYENTLIAFNAAQAALTAAQAAAMDDVLSNTLIQAVKEASTALATAKANRDLAYDALEKAQDAVVKTQTVASLLTTAGTVFGAAAAVSGANYQQGAVYNTQQAVSVAQLAAQQAAYTQLINPSTANSIALQQKNAALQAAQAAAASTALAAVTLPAAVESTTELANKAVSQAAAAIVAPSLSAHPYLQYQPITSPLVPVSNLAYDSAEAVSSNMPYNATAQTAPSYLLSNLGPGYNVVSLSNPSGTAVNSLRSQIALAVRTADTLVTKLVNDAQDWDSSGNLLTQNDASGNVSYITNKAIASANGQLNALTLPNAILWDTSNNYIYNIIPPIATSLALSAYADRAILLAQSGASEISNYESGALTDTSGNGSGLNCGIASAAICALAVSYPVTKEELLAEVALNFPFGNTDIFGNSYLGSPSGAYTGITSTLVNLRNIIANTTLATRRTTTAAQAANDSKTAFLKWYAASEKVNVLSSKATTLYGMVPAPSTSDVLEMDTMLLEAKSQLSAATYELAVAENYAVITARLAHQSATSTSVFMGNRISNTFDQLGNLNGVSSSDSSGYQGLYTDTQQCPLIQTSYFGLNGTPSKNALIAAQAMAQAAANDNYLTTTINSIGVHSISGLDGSSNQTVTLTGTRLLVQDAQYAAAGASAQVANIAFADASESVARYTDWHNISAAANSANAASLAVSAALVDASGNSANTRVKLQAAVEAITSTLTKIIAATTPYNQQSTPSATIANNNVVVLAAKLENAKNVSLAAQAAIELASSTYSTDASGTNISGSPNGQGGAIFTVNMAYAKVTANAAQAACTAAAILAREQAVLAARRANYTALALKKLVGDSVIGEAIAGFLDASGNLVSQTGYGQADPSGTTVLFPLRKAASHNGTNGYKPPSVTASTILYQGSGGIYLDAAGYNVLGNPNQPSLITNLTYTTSQYSDVYSATSGLVSAAQNVITALNLDSSGNSEDASVNIAPYVLYPNINAVNALNATDSSGIPRDGLAAVQACLRSAYEAQQWVVASANASFVTFGFSPQNVNLISFTPSLLGVINKLASDADLCLDTVLNAEGAILYALSTRIPAKRLLLHDVDAANFAAAVNANQSAVDTYLALNNAATTHEANTRITYHMADLTNSLSPLAAAATTAAAQAAALGGLAFSAPTPNPNVPSTNALRNANFPNNYSNNTNYAVTGWNSSSLPSNGFSISRQTANSTNLNLGPYNGTATGAAPFPAPNASSTSRIPAPAAQVLQYSSQLLNFQLSNAALAVSKAAADSTQSITDFNNLMVQVSTVTPSLVDAATTASSLTLDAAQLANYATSMQTQGEIYPNQGSLNTTASLLQKEYEAVLDARNSARANLQAITPTNARYDSRKNMLDLWNIAVTAAAAAVAASDGGPTNYPAGIDPANIVPASLGDPSIMGTAPRTGAWVAPLSGNSAPVYYVEVGNTAMGSMQQVTYGSYGSVSAPQPSLLAQLNAAVINAYNATTGARDASGTYRYIQFLDESSNVKSNFPENINDTNQAYNNAVAALRANAAIANAKLSALQVAALKIAAAYEAALAVAAGPPPLLTDDPSGNNFLVTSPSTLSSVVDAALTGLITPTTTFTKQQAAAQIAVAFWNSANQYVTYMLDPSGNSPPPISLQSVFNLMAIVGINFTLTKPTDTTGAQQSISDLANRVQTAIQTAWAQGEAAGYNSTQSWSVYSPTNGNSLTTSAGSTAVGLGSYTGTNYFTSAGIASGSITDPVSGTSYSVPTGWGAFYWTLAISDPNNQTSGIALQAATDAWNAVETLLNSLINTPSLLDLHASNANMARARALYSVKIAIQSAARAAASAEASANASNTLGAATNSYEDLAGYAASEAFYASTGNLNMYRCVPDIAMHADADDLPVIFRLNGSTVYVGGTSIAAAMFAGFLGVVQSHAPINYFVNPLLYDNYTFPSPLFNDISGSSQVWYTGSPGGSTIPPRIANVLPGLPNPTSGLGSGLYNLNVGLGSINGMNLAALMEVPHLVSSITPASGPSASTAVYPGTSSTVTVYVEPVTAYNPFVVWSSNSLNVTVSQTNGPTLSNNGMNDTLPYTVYNPLLHDASGNALNSTLSVGSYDFGSVGNAVIGKNPFHVDSRYPTGYPCLVFSATVTGVSAVASSAPLPIITATSTDGSNVYGSFSVVVLPAIQVTGVSISLEDKTVNPANTTLFLGKTAQLVATVTPLSATNQRVFWWSSNSSIVNVDASGLLTSLAPGQVTIKATSLNNNISASISVYVPTPITGIDVLPRSITLNPNMTVYPLKNNAIIRAIIQPAEADYKHLTWEIVSSTQSLPAPVGISNVISIPRDGTVIARDSNGDITDNTQATVSAVSNGTAVLRVTTYGEPYGVYGTYTATVTVNVVTPITDIVMTETDMIINLNPHTAEYDSSRSLPESYQVTATLKPSYPSNMNVFWSSSNPKVAVVSNNSPAVLNTITSDPNFGLWQITETIRPLSNGTTVIKVTTADGQKTSMTTVVVTTPVTGISISALPVVLNPTKLYNLQATVLPVTATNKELVWESTNTDVATVDSFGQVKAVSSGSCGISVRTVDGDFTAISQISVVTPLVGIQLLVNTPLPIKVGDSVQILVVMVPTIATNQLFTWTVSDGPMGAILTTGSPQNGNIVFLEAFQPGNAVFTVTAADGNKQASINLQVLNHY
jgi:uncharacterized protein YjdB